VQCFGRIGLASATAVSDISRNRFFLREKVKSYDGNTGRFHCLPDELQLTAVIYAHEHSPDTLETNSRELDLQ